MRGCILFGTLVLAASALLAQDPPDFSGVYLLNSEARPQHKAKAHKHADSRVDPRILAMQQMEESLEVGSPLVLIVNQSESTLEVTRHQLGVTSTVQYNLTGKETRNRGPWGLVTRDRAKVKKQKLVIETTVESAAVGGFELSGTGPIRVSWPYGHRIKEIWEFRPDVQMLLIRSNFPLYSSGAGFEAYSRQSSLEGALAKADAASLMKKCSNLMMPPIQQGHTKYDDGVRIGFTAYCQLGRCVEFDAGLRRESLAGLERTTNSGAAEFWKNGRPVSEYPESVILEVQPRVFDCRLVGLLRIPEEYLDLRFHVLWTGSATRDLGEVRSELMSEPWPELRPPERFYRMKIPSGGIALTDSLEIHILSPDGESLGCISGHI